MKTVISEGRHVLGKLSRNCDKAAPRNCEAALTWELRKEGDKLEFSACGEVWNHLKTDIVRGGQCVDDLAALFPRDKLAQRMAHTWAAYHLNGMNAGTPEQTAFIRTLPDDVRRDYTATCAALESASLLDVPVTPELRASALGGLPEDATSYKYGSRWLYFALPDDVVSLIKNGFMVGDDATAPDPEESGEPDRDLIEEAGLTVSSVFIPHHHSRNKGDKNKSLNWRVTLLCKGRRVLDTDYSAGSAHAPASKRKWEDNRTREAAINDECENGKEITRFYNIGRTVTTGKKIEPDARQVISALLLDANVLDAGCFEDWAAGYGYDADSMKARATYDQCMQHALALRAAVGPGMFAALIEGNQ